MKLSDLKNTHQGETIWVLGSGPTMNFIDPVFFEDKITVATNIIANVKGFTANYTFSNYHRVTQEVFNPNTIHVTLLRDTESHELWAGDVPQNVIFVEQPSYQAPGSAWNPLTTHKPLNDSLVYGSSSLHGSMHLAAYLGACFIILIGADCGTLDGQHRTEGYRAGHNPWALYDRHHQLLKTYLQENYDTKVYSLNPFINFNLEGHKFEGV